MGAGEGKVLLNSLNRPHITPHGVLTGKGQVLLNSLRRPHTTLHGTSAAIEQLYMLRQPQYHPRMRD